MKTSGRASEDEQGSVNFAICETEKQEHDAVFFGQDDGTVISKGSRSRRPLKALIEMERNRGSRCIDAKSEARTMLSTFTNMLQLQQNMFYGFSDFVDFSRKNYFKLG